MIKKEAANLLRHVALERISQLEEKSDNLNIVKKQNECLDLIDEVIFHANQAANGLVEIVVTDKQFSKDAPVEKILSNAIYTIGTFNVERPDLKGILMRTIIVIDPLWRSDKLQMFRCSLGLPTSMLTEVSWKSTY